MSVPCMLLLPRGPMRLRHNPFEIELPDRLEHVWSVPLPRLGPRLALTSADGHPLLVRRDGVAVLDGDSSGDPASWPCVALPAGRPGTAVKGPLLWVTDDGRLLRFTLDGAVAESGLSADAGLALDHDRVLIARRGDTGKLVLLVNGVEVWRASGTLADACPGHDVMVAGVPGDARRLSGLDLSSGRRLWTGAPEPYGLSAVVAVKDDLVWVACADRMLAALSLRDGRLVYAHDTGVRVPIGGVDCNGRLHLCHQLAWVSVRLMPEPEIREHLRISGISRLIDPPIPVRGGQLLVRTVRGEVLLFEESGVTLLWRGAQPVWGVAAIRGRLYLLEGEDPPVLHCLTDPLRAS